MTGIIIFTLLMMAIAGLSNSIMDTLRYRYEGSVFESLSQKRSPIGRFFKAWAGPQSHLNKFWLDEHPIWGPLFGWLFHGPLIFTTSLWHFSKFTMLSSLQIGSIGVLFLMEKLTFYQGLWYFFAMKFVFRFIFELFFPSYENDRRELWEARYRSMSRLAIPRFKNKGAIRMILITTLLGIFLIYQMMGGIAPGFGITEKAAVAGFALCFTFIWFIQSDGVRRMAG